MKPFMDEDFLLHSDTARILYHNYAKKMPIIDYHCHVDPKEIYENRRFNNITEAWLEGDHYKWRAIRSNGVDESLITGESDPKDRLKAYAAIMPKCIGNPLYHWSHLELKRYFDYDGILSLDTFDDIWDVCQLKLSEPQMSVRGLIKQSGVKLICTTDDPADSLEYHRLIAEDNSIDCKVLPAFRPERSMALHLSDFAEYINRLGESSGVNVTSFAGLRSALSSRLDFFAFHGCVASDHSLSYAFYRPANPAKIEEVFKKALNGESVLKEETEIYQTALLVFLGREYARRGWVMQLHMGPVRNTRTNIWERIGADAGCDCMGPALDSRPLAAFLDALDRDGLLPKTVLYSLNPNDNAMLGTLIGSFQSGDAIGKLQHGSAWWFNDTLQGMKDQLTSLASTSLLGNFIGMLTDSRSFLSYTRHEYFRRILCDLIGGWVEDGLYPADIEGLGRLIEDICYNNTKNYFGFDL